jgi:hypothetical protein
VPGHRVCDAEWQVRCHEGQREEYPVNAGHVHCSECSGRCLARCGCNDDTVVRRRDRPPLEQRAVLLNSIRRGRSNTDCSHIHTRHKSRDSHHKIRSGVHKPRPNPLWNPNPPPWKPPPWNPLPPKPPPWNPPPPKPPPPRASVSWFGVLEAPTRSAATSAIVILVAIMLSPFPLMVAARTRNSCLAEKT